MSKLRPRLDSLAQPSSLLTMSDKSEDKINLNCSYCLKVIPPNLKPVTELEALAGKARSKISVFSAILRIFNLNLDKDSRVELLLSQMPRDLRLCKKCGANLLNLYTIHEQFTRLAALESHISKLIKIIQKTTPSPGPDPAAQSAQIPGSSQKSVSASLSRSQKKSALTAPRSGLSQRSAPSLESPTYLKSGLAKKSTTLFPMSRTLKATVPISEPKSEKSTSACVYWPVEVSVGLSVSDTSTAVSVAKANNEAWMRIQPPSTQAEMNELEPVVIKQEAEAEANAGMGDESDGDDGMWLDQDMENIVNDEEDMDLSWCYHPDCMLSFQSAEQLKVHLKYHQDGPKYTVEGSNQIENDTKERPTSSSAAVSISPISSPRPNYICPEAGCRKSSFSTLKDLRSHMQVQHGFQIEQNDRRYKRVQSQSPHDPTSIQVKPKRKRPKRIIRNRKKLVQNIPCTLCTKLFVSNSRLRQHVDSYHLNLKPWPCTTCDKTFTTKASLITHTKLHSSDDVEAMKALCCICGKLCSSKYYLKQHYQTHFPDQVERPFKCDLCDKTYTRLAHLTVHKLSHLNERTFSCDVCQKKFNSQETLKGHKKFHSRPHRCPDPACEKFYATRSILKFHLVNTHHLSNEEANSAAGIISKVQIICTPDNASL